MGTSGNRPGYKIFSINTTIRNPNRNDDFLQNLVEYNGKIFDSKVLNSYILKLISKGVYKVSKVSEEVKQKIECGIELSVGESLELLKNNPQACGISGRVMTQLRALKDQNLLKFISIKKGINKIFLTKFAWDLLNSEEPSTDIYSKIMIGMHANNPSRTAIYNQSRPFLNTIFVINEVNTLWKKLGRSNTGIAYHEFGAFVLSMKDCDYKKAANEIIKYRLLYNFKIDKEYLNNYCLNKLNLLNSKFENITTEYPDDVYRKFAMTGLLMKRNRSFYSMIDFSNYNMAKIKNLLIFYKDYKFHSFNNIDEYFEFLENKIVLPWQINKNTRIAIAKDKAKKLGIQIANYDKIEQIEQQLDDKFYFNILSKTLQTIKFESIKEELLILSGVYKKTSKFNQISEPLRLEYLLALALGKKFGIKGLISNIIYNEDGIPLHHAPSKRPDIIYKNDDSCYILEPTMSKNYSQQTNTETTSICDHVKSEEIKDKKVYRTMMIAPFVHSRVTHFFKFTVMFENFKIIPLTINAFVHMIDESSDIGAFKNKFDILLSLLISQKYEEYTDKINSYKD